ncbi:MAG: clan AA aspartic protease [Chloroflexi bacterium]|nr:clan AA aspartic protease [Chloroflexota bacterium]
MGITQVPTTVRNPADPEKAWEGLFLVDTGAIDCLAPRPQLEAIGLMPKGERLYNLADGSEVRMEVTVAEIEVMGEIVGATIVFGEANAEPLLGVTALESAGIEVDPHNQTLRRLPSTRLRGFRVGR